MEKTSLLQFGPVAFDLRTNSATARDEPVDLSARETMVLRALMDQGASVKSVERGQSLTQRFMEATAGEAPPA